MQANKKISFLAALCAVALSWGIRYPELWRRKIREKVERRATLLRLRSLKIQPESATSWNSAPGVP